MPLLSATGKWPAPGSGGSWNEGFDANLARFFWKDFQLPIANLV
jgi:hypothetical protein